MNREQQTEDVQFLDQVPFIGDDSVEWSDASLASCLNNIYKLSPAFIKVNDKTL